MKYPAPPAPSTLARYGGTIAQWRALWRAQGGKCGHCGGEHARYVIDHWHVPGWDKMTAAERWSYVRGIIGVAENHWLLGIHVTLEKARNTVAYLERFEERRGK